MTLTPLLLLLALGCEVPVGESCASANDGVCGEPTTCGLGTDEADCVAACADPAIAPFVGAACAFREPPTRPELDASLGTGGSDHRTGRFERTFRVPSGADPSTEVDRHVSVYVPRSYDPAIPAPLVLVLPGNRAPIDSLPAYTQIEPTADAERFIVAYVEQEWRWNQLAGSWWTDWDWDAQPAAGHPDLLLLRAIVAELSDAYNLDPTRVFAAGHSRGAAMALIAALELPELIAGAVVQSGFSEFGWHERIAAYAGRRTPLFFMHGDIDADVCITCTAGGLCNGRSCGTSEGSDSLVAMLRTAGWDDDTLVYERLENVAHRWQPWLNQRWWDFVSARPLDPERAPPRDAARRHDARFPGSDPLFAEASPRAPTRAGGVAIPAGGFDMGEPDVVPGPYGDAWFVDQQPQHRVELSAFELQATEVTVAEFAGFLTFAGGERHFHPDQPIERTDAGTYLPVVGAEARAIHQITWDAAHDYCRWIGGRLPTEAEWERAAAGTEGRPYPWAEGGLGCARAAGFMDGSYCADGALDVGARPLGATPEGIEDLAGNVAEWVADWYGPYGAEARTDPSGPPEGAHRVVRGGGFLHSSQYLRTRARWSAPPTTRSDAIGVRCAFDAGDPEEPPALAALRGELPALPAGAREPSPRPRAPASPEPELLAEGLGAPTAVVPWEGGFAVLDPAGGRVVTVDADGAVQPLLDGLEGPADLVAGGGALFVTERAGGRLVRVAGGAVEVVAEGLDAPGRMAAEGATIFFVTATSLSSYDGAAIEELAGGLDAPDAPSATADAVYFVVRGAAAASEARAVRLDRASGALSDVIANAPLGEAIEPRGVVLDPSGLPLVALMLRPWPSSSALCRPVGTGLSCVAYGPPGLDRVARVGDQVVWGTSRSLAAVGPDGGTYRLPGLFSRPGGIADDAGRVVWTDTLAGRLLRSAAAP